MVKSAFRYTLVVVVLGATFLIGSWQGLAQAKDPLIGTWELDTSKSTYTGAPAGAPPFRREMMFEQVDNGIKNTTITRDAVGGVNTSEYTAKFDGKDYPAPVESALDTNSIMRVDANTIERMGKIKGQVVETVMYAVSPDGKVLTVTQKGMVNGINYGSVQIFNRQED
jgi:hypothetical protein